MNWYIKIIQASRQKKTASVTFRIGDGADKISKPKNILNLSFELSSFFYNGSQIDHNTSPLMNAITPDGDDFDKFIGTINIYPAPRVAPPENMSQEAYYALSDASEEEQLRRGFKKYNNSIEEMMPVIDEWIQIKAAEGYIIEKKSDISNMSKGPVLRLIVKENPSENYAKIPEVHMNNANAFALLQTVGISPDYSGSISPDDLIRAVNNVQSEDVSRNVPPESIEYGEDGKIPIYRGGIDEQYIDQRLQELYELADFAKSNGFREIYWG